MDPYMFLTTKQLGIGILWGEGGRGVGTQQGEGKPDVSCSESTGMVMSGFSSCTLCSPLYMVEMLMAWREWTGFSRIP